MDMSHAYVPDDDFGSNSGFDIYLVWGEVIWK
jgi:hypothetical protein